MTTTQFKLYGRVIDVEILSSYAIGYMNSRVDHSTYEEVFTFNFENSERFVTFYSIPKQSHKLLREILIDATNDLIMIR